tara:strand:+ start:81 stop:488 length:408 start_codon:yes stop_codon:yes gene_type:complete
MKLNIRMLEDSDWNTLVKWWAAWPEWPTPPKDFLPDNGKGGFMVEKEGQPIVAGFLYTTNSKVALLEFIISNPEYREKDRGEAIELLINGAETVSKKQGIKYIFCIGSNKKLIETHKKLGYSVDEKPSYEITKII